MKRKGRALEAVVREREFESLLRRASEIMSAHHAHPPSAPKILPLVPKTPRIV